MRVTRILAVLAGALALTALAGLHSGTTADVSSSRPLAVGSSAAVQPGTVSPDDLTWGQ